MELKSVVLAAARHRFVFEAVEVTPRRMSKDMLIIPLLLGNIVMGIPLAPTAFTTLWEDEERFYKGYMKRFDGKWIDTGDAGMIDEDGYISIMARADDVINVAAHRFSTGGSLLGSGKRWQLTCPRCN